MASNMIIKGCATPDSPQRCSDDMELQRLLNEITNSADYSARNRESTKDVCVIKNTRNELKENKSNWLEQIEEIPNGVTITNANVDEESLKPTIPKLVLSSDEASEDSENSQPVPLSAFLTTSSHFEQDEANSKPHLTSPLSYSESRNRKVLQKTSASNTIPSSKKNSICSKRMTEIKTANGRCQNSSNNQVEKHNITAGGTHKPKIQPTPKLLSSRKLKSTTSDPGSCTKPVYSIKSATTQGNPKPRTTIECMPAPSKNTEVGCGEFNVVSNKVFSVNSRCFHALGILGEGGCGKVYQVIESRTGFIFALKEVNLKKGDATLVKNEIEILNKLHNSDRVIKMLDYELKADVLLIILERGDCDFSRILKQVGKEQPLSSIQVKYYWSELLLAVADIHKAGIIHLDLKPANFVQVMGKLKLIDFGIAGAIPDDKTCIVKENQVGTINYMSPEQLTGSHDQGQFQLRTKSDVWSLGCILYHLLFGCTPFHHITQMMSKLAAISNPNYKIMYPKTEDQAVRNVLESCLQYNPKSRPTIDELLNHPYLTGSGSGVK